MSIGTKILLGTIYQGSFEDYKDAAEEMALEKCLPVSFEWGGFIYTVEKTKQAKDK